MIDKKFSIELKSLIQSHKGNILLIKEENRLAWDLPGMKLNFGDNLYASLWKHIDEKMGLTIDVVRPNNLWSVIKRDIHTIGITFYCETEQETISKNQEDEKDAPKHVWINKDKVLRTNVPKWIKDEIRKLDDQKKKDEVYEPTENKEVKPASKEKELEKKEQDVEDKLAEIISKESENKDKEEPLYKKYGL